MMRLFGGGGGNGSGGMLRTVARGAITRGTAVGGVQVQDPPTNKPNKNKTNSSALLSLSSSSSSSSPFNLAVSAPQPPFPCDEFEWVSVSAGSTEDENSPCFFYDGVPQAEEVQGAVSALQQVFEPASDSQLTRGKFNSVSEEDEAGDAATCACMSGRICYHGPESDWFEPSMQLYNAGSPHASDQVYNAIHLLQTDPSVQRMVVSLSTDKVVWDAVLNNEVVQELRKSFDAGGNECLNSDVDSDSSYSTASRLKWLFHSTKTKMEELVETISKFMNQLLNAQASKVEQTTETNPFEKKTRTAFMLSVLVILIVVVARANGTRP